MIEGLDIKVIEEVNDLDKLVEQNSYLRKCKSWGKDNKYFVVAFLNNKFVGFWDGDVGRHVVPVYTGAKDPCFFSNMIFSKGRYFGVKGIGTAIKQHQLKYARDELKCKSSYCEVLNPHDVYAL